MINLALITRSTTNRPETFVQSHRDGIKAQIFFYYGDLVPRYLEGGGLISIDRNSLGSPKVLMRQLLKINPISFYKSKLGYFEYMLAMSLKDNKIDVALAEYGDVSACVLDACKYAHLPLIAHFHGRDCSAYMVLERYKEKYKQLFDYCPYIVVVSHGMADKLVSLGCSRHKIVYAPCVPDQKYYELHPSYDKPQFYSVGRFVDKKAPYITLLAFKKVLDYHPEARLVMAGDGPLWPTCKNLVKILGLSEAVTLPSGVSPKQNISFIESSLAYVQHSVTALDGDMEGTPVAVMEASAAGLPVISTYHAGIPDVIVNGETGLLCPEYDVDGMAENMLRVIEDHDLAVRFGDNGKKRMKQCFSKEEQMRILTETVNKAANRRK